MHLQTVAVLALALALGACGDGSHSGIAAGGGSVAPDPTPVVPRRSYPACYDPAATTAPTVAGHACTWWHQALSLQDRVDFNEPLQSTLWLATHNSANASVYPGPSSSGDPNQTLSITDQLRLDMRGLELDVHWYPHIASGGMAPVLCHALGASMNHTGCSSSDRHLREGLQEIANFLRTPGNEEVVLMVDIEDQLADFVFPNSSRDNPAAYAAAVAAIESELGTLVYRPTVGGGCQAMPLTLTKAQVLASGAQIILTAGCGTGAPWTDWVFNITSIRRQKANDGFDGPPACESPFFTAADYLTRWTRLWHDSTQLGARTNPALQPIDAPTLRDMLACGVHMPSIDLLRSDDARAEASIWSWAVGQPGRSTAAQCARLESDGRFHAVDCTAIAAYACRSASGWQVTAANGPQSFGVSACATEYPGSVFGVPSTGAQSQALMAARQAMGANTVWLHYRDNSGVGDWRVSGE